MRKITKGTCTWAMARATGQDVTTKRNFFQYGAKVGLNATSVATIPSPHGVVARSGMGYWGTTPLGWVNY